MQLDKHLTLASQSRVRGDILRGAGLAFDTQVSGVDEAALKDRHEGYGAALALALAEAKALAVSADGLVLAADQILQCGDRLYDKPADMAEARVNLLSLRGRTHHLINGLVLAENGSVIWRYNNRVGLTMRDFSETFLDAYLAEAGDAVLSSVGAYQLEGLGAHLFEAIDGDNFSVMGLPLLPLLGALRQYGGLPA